MGQPKAPLIIYGGGGATRPLPRNGAWNSMESQQSSHALNVTLFSLLLSIFSSNVLARYIVRFYFKSRVFPSVRGV